MTSFQKIIKYIAMAFAIFLAIGIFTGILGAFTVANFIFGEKENIVGEMKTYSVSNQITQLDVDLNVAEVNIKTGNKLRVESNHKNLVVKEKNGTLQVSEKKKFFTTKIGKASVEIYLPEGKTLEKAEVSTGLGGAKIEGLNCGKFDFSQGVGRTEILKTVITQKAEIDSGVGVIKLKSCSFSNAEINNGIGFASYSGKMNEKCSFDSGIGACEIVLSGNESDYSVEIGNGIGFVTVNGQKAFDGNDFGTGKNDIECDNGIGRMKIIFG